MTEMKTVLEYEAPARDGTEACQAISARPMFWRPAYLETSAWLEHVPFAFWLMAAHRPKTFVELGSHYGVSYFAFCQAAERLGLDTRCFAVDTWKGDEHAGFYEEKVFTQVRRHNEANYSGFSRLVRSTFDDALAHFSDGSIDLLHIDGLHTYEAVRHDFEAWLPKLSENAVIVMHDTNVRERNFGVFRLFEELKQTYPSFEFAHGHGLGVLSLKPAHGPMLQRLFEIEKDKAGKPAVQEMFSRLGRACADSLAAARNQKTAGKYRGEATKHTKQIEDLKLALDKTKTDFTNRSKELNETRAKLQKQAEENAGERAQLIERCTLLEQLRKELKDDAARLQARIDQLEANAASRVDELRQAETLALTHQQALVKAEAGHQRQLVELNDTIAALRESGEQQAGQFALLQCQIGTLEAENAGIRLVQAQERAQYQDELAAQSEKLDALESENAGLNLAHVQAQVHYQNELSAQQEVLEQARMLGDQTSAALQAAERELERLASTCHALSEEKARLAADLALAKDNAQRLDQTLPQASGDNAQPNMETSPLVVDEDVQKLSKENTVLRTENQKLAASVEVRFGELAKLTQMLTARDESLRAQKEETAALARRLAASEKVQKESQQAGEKTKVQLRKSEEQLGKLQEQRGKLQEQLGKLQEQQGKLQEQLRKSSEQLSRSDEQLRKSDEQLRRSEDLMQARENDFQQIARQLAQSAALHGVPDAKAGSFARLGDRLAGRKIDRQEQKLVRQAVLLRSSGLFDDAWYLSRYPDVEQSRMDPAVHYLRFGAAERRDPGPLFSTGAYVESYPDVAESSINPLVHYINHGSKEARTIHGSQAR